LVNYKKQSTNVQTLCNIGFFQEVTLLNFLGNKSRTHGLELA